MNFSRITLFAGHYGSGKTNIAVNYAIALRENHTKVLIADLDIVNPYFRTKDGEDQLLEKGIHLISSDFANSNLEAPSMPPAALSLFDDKSAYGVIDVGGDDRGAYAVGKYARLLAKEPSVSLFLVVNCYRPLSKTPEDAIEIMREIEAAAHIKFTGIVNNSNLGAKTTAEDVLRSISYVNEISNATELPIAFTSVRDEILTELGNEIPSLLGLTIMSKNSWRI